MILTVDKVNSMYLMAIEQCLNTELDRNSSNELFNLLILTHIFNKDIEHPLFFIDDQTGKYLIINNTMSFNGYCIEIKYHDTNSFTLRAYSTYEALESTIEELKKLNRIVFGKNINEYHDN